MKPILNTTRSLMAPLIVDIIPQMDLAYNKKKLAEWRDKELKALSHSKGHGGGLIANAKVNTPDRVHS